MSRPPTPYRKLLCQDIRVRPQTADAFRMLSEVSGMSVNTLVRAALETYAEVLGLVGQHELVVTPYRRTDKEN